MTKPEPQLRVSKKALTTVATWSENHNKKILLGDIPRAHLLYNTLQDHHLLDLQEIVRKVFYTSFQDESTAFEACLKQFPDVALHFNDEYMAALINSVLDNSDVETLFVVCGVGQSRSIPHYL